MTIIHDFSPVRTFEETNQQRLELIDKIDHAQADPSPLRKIKAAYLSRKALKLAQREEVYTLSSEDLLHRAVALNPNIQDRAHEVLDQLYAEDHPELAEPMLEQLSPAQTVAHEVLDRTVELSLDLNDDTPTVPIPVILNTANEVIHAEQVQYLPESIILSDIADKHEAIYWQEQKEEALKAARERVENATNEQMSEEDDARSLTPEEMRALMFDDEQENTSTLTHAA